MKKTILILIFVFFIPVLSFYQPITTENIDLAILVDGKEESNFPLKDSGYFYEKLICNNENAAKFDSNNWNLQINNIKGNLKCTISFLKNGNKTLLKNAILNQEGGSANIIKKGSPNFNEIANTDEGIFMMKDDYGDSFYYRGNVTDNNVFFANMFWKIVRINGDGSIRLLFNGLNNSTNMEEKNIAFAPLNSSSKDNAFVGYMHGYPNSNNYASTHENVFDSDAKSTIDSWYALNLNDYASRFSDTVFCNDRSTINAGYGQLGSSYTSMTRVLMNHAPSLLCAQKNDRFTVNDEIVGNGALKYPIALLTADEAMLAGLVRDKENKDFYLCENKICLSNITMTPGSFVNNSSANALYAANWWYSYDFGNSNVIGKTFLRPVINLKSTTEILKGNGTRDNPFFVV